MSSFYGGKQGRSYRIVEHYDNIATMVEHFGLGNGYTDVGYDEYVIIDTIINNNEKSNPENGLLYRRGYNYNEAPFYEDGAETVHNAEIAYQQAIGTADEQNKYNDYITKRQNYYQKPGAGAIYVGQIVGPQGDATPIEMLTWDDFQEETGAAGKQGVMEPVPGYDKDQDEYHDVINYGSYTIKNANGNITGAYISFNFPYTVFDFDVDLIDPYNLPENLIEEQEDSTDHPYYKHYKFYVPKGKHGQEVSEIGIYQLNSDGSYTKLENISSLQGRTNLFFGYKIKDYETDVNGIETDLQGKVPYKVIESVTVGKRADRLRPSKLIFKYTDGTVYEPEYNIIDSVEVDNTTKQITIKQSGEGTNPISFTLQEISAVVRNSNNELEIQYNTGRKASFPITEMADIKLEGDNVKIGFRNLSISQAKASFPTIPENLITEENNLVYINFGSIVKGQHVLRNYTTVSELEADFPQGLEGDRAGWLVTVGNSEDGYDLYAYDYVQEEWYSIQKIGADLIDPAFMVLVAEDDGTGEPDHGKVDLNERGLWLIKESKAPVLSLRVTSRGIILDTDDNELLPSEVIAKIEDGYKIEAFWQSTSNESFENRLFINRILPPDNLSFTCINNNALQEITWLGTDGARFYVNTLIEL